MPTVTFCLYSLRFKDTTCIKLSGQIHDELICEQEIGDSHDPQAVVMKKEIDGITSTVGHVLHEISLICSGI